MLVIVSDLHLTDGTTGLRIPAGAFRVFRERLEDMAYDASKRADNTYKPIREFDLVLLGDIFDLLRSTKWNDQKPGEEGFARPWMDPNDPAVVDKIDEIVDGILQKNEQSLKILRDLANGTSINLPPPTTGGQVDRRVSYDRRSKRRLPVKVNIHYMNGNHDWFFHLPGEPYDRIREKVIKHMGLRNPKSPFPHDPGDSNVIQSIFENHSVTARHGDIYDPFNYVKDKGRNFSCLGDALVVELFNPIPKLIAAELGDQMPKEFYDDLSEMGSIRPSTMTPVWIASLLEQHKIEDQKIDAINQIWRKLIENFLELDFLSKLDKPGLDLVDSLEFALGGLKRLSLQRLDDFAPMVDRLIHIHAAVWGGGEFGFDENATEETAYQLKQARFVVFGHTHGYKVVPLRTTSKGRKPFDQIYINTGTWHPIHELAKVDPKNRGFIMHKTMSYVGFYHGDEHQERAFETWSGALEL